MNYIDYWDFIEPNRNQLRVSQSKALYAFSDYERPLPLQIVHSFLTQITDVRVQEIQQENEHVRRNIKVPASTCLSYIRAPATVPTHFWPQLFKGRITLSCG